MRRRRALVVVAALGPFVVASGVGVGAEPIQLPLLTPTTKPGDPPPKPLLSNPLAPPAAKPPAPGPPPPAAKAPAPAPPPPLVGSGSPDGGPIPADAGPFPGHLAAMMKSVKRSGPRNTKALMDALRPLEGLGVPHEEIIRVGMGRFPVGGYAHYSHDWWYPRFGPGWRLHQGTDIFAAQGTPVRSPADGVLRFSDGGLGGISTYVVEGNGTYYYMAHLSGRPPGLREGQAVRTGDIVGYVGDSGNAEGGTPHLHFEYHPAQKTVTRGSGKRRTTEVVPIRVTPGAVLPAVDPKGHLDAWLNEAEANVEKVKAAYQAANPGVPLTIPSNAALVPGAPIAPLQVGTVAALPPARRAFSERPLATTPLAALAFLLVVVTGSLTPVVAGPASPSGRARSEERAPEEGRRRRRKKRGADDGEG